MVGLVTMTPLDCQVGIPKPGRREDLSRRARAPMPPSRDLGPEKRQESSTLAQPASQRSAPSI